MSQPRVIILAAGSGSRLQAGKENLPKPLFPFGGEPILLRAIRQLRRSDFSEITVVLGHQAALLQETLAAYDPHVRAIQNQNYATDTNSLSTLLGLEERIEPALIWEADVIISDNTLPHILQQLDRERSTWVTQGLFQPHQLGGILRATPTGDVVDLRYTKEFRSEFANYHKLLGLLYVGPSQIEKYLTQLKTAVAHTTQQYYMTPWCEHLTDLPCRFFDISPEQAGTFNTLEEYERCLKRLQPELLP